jgi:hypothetical protein
LVQNFSPLLIFPFFNVPLLREQFIKGSNGPIKGHFLFASIYLKYAALPSCHYNGGKLPLKRLFTTGKRGSVLNERNN